MMQYQQIKVLENKSDEEINTKLSVSNIMFIQHLQYSHLHNHSKFEYNCF